MNLRKFFFYRDFIYRVIEAWGGPAPSLFFLYFFIRGLNVDCIGQQSYVLSDSLTCLPLSTDNLCILKTPLGSYFVFLSIIVSGSIVYLSGRSQVLSDLINGPILFMSV